MSLHEDYEPRELDHNVFINTQIQSNLDLWDQREKTEKSVTALKKYAMDQGENSLLHLHSPVPEVVTKTTEKTYKKPGKKKPVTRKKESDGVKSITGQMAKRHAKTADKQSILKLLSGKKRKVNDILDKIEAIESKGISSNSPSQESDNAEEKMVYSKSEWFNLLKIIRVNFPSLSKKSKLSLSKINKIYEEQYDSQYQPSLEDSSSETPSLWHMASTLPKVRLTPEDLKWLYDLDTLPEDDNEKSTSALSSVSEANEDTNNIFTLSQLVNDRKKELGIGSEVIDLTQPHSTKEKDPNLDMLAEAPTVSNAPVYITDSDNANAIEVINGETMEAAEVEGHSPQAQHTEVISEEVVPTEFATPKLNRVVEIPSSSPRVSPIKMSPSKMLSVRKNLKSAKSLSRKPSGQVEINASISFGEKSLKRVKSVLESIKSSGSYNKAHNSELSSPIKKFMDEDDIEEVRSISDSQGSNVEGIANVCNVEDYDDAEFLKMVNGSLALPKDFSTDLHYEPHKSTNSSERRKILKELESKASQSGQILDGILGSDEYKPHQDFAKLTSQDLKEFLKSSSDREQDADLILTKYTASNDNLQSAKLWGEAPTKSKDYVDVVSGTNNETNQLKNISIDNLGGHSMTEKQRTGHQNSLSFQPELSAVFRPHFPQSIDVKSNSTVYSTARSYIEATKEEKLYKTTTYEFKGYLNEVFLSPFKEVETKIRHTKRLRELDVIPDSESENDGDEDISIIEIKRRNDDKPRKAVPSVKSTLISSDDEDDAGNVSELQVPLSPGLCSNKAVDEESKTGPFALLDTFRDSYHFKVFSNMSIVTLRLVMQKWGFKNKRSKQETVEFLAGIYVLLVLINDKYGIELLGSDSLVNTSKKPDKKALKEQLEKDAETLYEKLSGFLLPDIRAAIYNHINGLVLEQSDLYERILTYEPISINDVQNFLVMKGINLDLETIRDWCDNNSVAQSAALANYSDDDDEQQQQQRQKGREEPLSDARPSHKRKKTRQAQGSQKKTKRGSK